MLARYEVRTTSPTIRDDKQKRKRCKFTRPISPEKLRLTWTAPGCAIHCPRPRLQLSGIATVLSTFTTSRSLGRALCLPKGIEAENQEFPDGQIHFYGLKGTNN